MRGAQRRADDLVHVHRTRDEIGVVAPRRHLERVELARLGHRRERRLRHLVEVALALETARHARYARHLADDVGRLLRGGPIGALTQEHAQTARDAMDNDHGERLQQRFEVLEQPHLERRSIVPLEPDLVVMDQADALEFSHGYPSMQRDRA